MGARASEKGRREAGRRQGRDSKRVGFGFELERINFSVGGRGGDGRARKSRARARAEKGRIGRAEDARRGRRGARRTRSCWRRGAVSGGPERTLASGARALAACRARPGAPLALGLAARRADATAAGTTRRHVIVDIVRLEGDDACAASPRAQVWTEETWGRSNRGQRGPAHTLRSRLLLMSAPRPRQQQVWQKCRKQYSSSNFQKSSRPIGSRATTRPAPAASTLPRGRTRVRRTRCFVERISEPRWRRRSGTSATSRAPAT